MATILSRKPGGSGGGGGAPSGPAGGSLSGTYPNPGIAAGAVGAAEIAANAVGSSELADNAVDSGAIASGAVTAGKIASGVLLFVSYAVVEDQKAQGTAGGTFTQDDWRTRTLNTEVFDPDAIVSLAANQFTLQAGTYFIEARAPAWNVTQHQCRLRNITDGSTAGLGASAYSNGTGPDRDSVVMARVTIAAAKAFELQHYCRTTRATDGFGVASDIPSTTEVYSQVKIYLEG